MPAHVYARLSTDWSRAIRGADAFVDPHQQEVVELRAGYGRAWANSLGETILTADPSFNPNVHSTGTGRQCRSSSLR